MTPRPVALALLGIALACGAATDTGNGGGSTSSGSGSGSSSSGGSTSSGSTSSSGGSSTSSSGGSTSSSSGSSTSSSGGSTSGSSSSSGGSTSSSSSSGGPTILWHDDIQGTDPYLGFDGGRDWALGTEHPIGTRVAPSDANGANLSRVADPLGGGGYAMRHFGLFDSGGARAQAGIWGDYSPAFGDQARRPEGVWVAAEIYFPATITANGNGYCWLSVWDFHAVGGASRTARWDTQPGLLIARDGSMKLVAEWHHGATKDQSTTSTLAMPVGRWFDLEMHYEWTSTATGKFQVWIDGALALDLRNVQTYQAGSHDFPETYAKFYGSSQSQCPGWSPTPTIRFTRNVRVAGERIWRD